jgi:hypothetical protein
MSTTAQWPMRGYNDRHTGQSPYKIGITGDAVA